MNDDDEGETSFTLDGVQYVAHWFVANNMMTVHVDGFERHKETQVNSMDHDLLAKDMGRAIIRAAQSPT